MKTPTLHSNKVLKFRKSLFLIIQLLSRYSFDHWISKQDIFDHTTLKTVGHQAVLMGGFNFFIYNLVLRIWNDYYFLLVAPI
jgi:hypothetical protein